MKQTLIRTYLSLAALTALVASLGAGFKWK